jgi:hypothetical protein
MNKRKPKQLLKVKAEKLGDATQAALIADTLNFDMIKATVGMEDFKNEDIFPNGEAFSVKINVDDKDLKKLSRQHNLAEIFVNWPGKSNECMLEMGRTTFNKLGE